MERYVARRLIALVTGGATLPLVGCAARVLEPADEASGGGSDGPASTATGDPGDPSGATSTTSTTGPGESSDDGAEGEPQPRFDVATVPDIADDIPIPPGDCVDFRPDTPFVCADPVGPTPGYQCAPLPESGTCEDFDPQLLIDAVNECFDPGCYGFYAWEVGCGPDPNVDDMCCYWLMVEEGQLCPGRPFVVDGRERLAPLVTRSDWGGGAFGPPVADTRAREGMAAAFAEAAAFEHASVASFARFTLELLAVGAPPTFVAAAAQAAREEIEHARLWYGLAARYGHAVGPGPLPVDGAIASSVDLGDVIVRAIEEGCIAETISAWQARVVAASVCDPGLRARLEQLAEEELRHCELAWAFVGWALDRAPDLRPRVAAAFTRSTRHVPRGPALPEGLDPVLLRRHGLLWRGDRQRLAAEALERLVLPTARALLAARGRSTAVAAIRR